MDRAALTPPVCRALGRPTADLLDWRSTAIHDGMSGGDVCRISGQAQDGAEVVPWSLIRKVIRAPERAGDPADTPSWKREALIYAAGLLNDLPGRLRAPRCYGIDQTSPAEVTLWQEDVPEAVPEWPLSRYALAARHLGQFNGAHLAARPLPDQHFLHRGWLRSGIVRGMRGIERRREVAHHPLLRRCYPPHTVARLEQLAGDHLQILEAIFARLPMTFCHLDANRRNLLATVAADGQEETVAIDWGQAGLDPVGIDLTCLVHSSLIWRFRGRLEQARDLDQCAFAGYVERLRDAGWHPAPRRVRFAFTAITAIHYTVRSMSFQTSHLLNEASHPWLEQVFGCPLPEVCDHWAELYRFHLDLTDEARGLMSALA